MTTLIRLLPGLLILVSMAVNADGSTITKCVDANGKVTFSTMGCKSSEVDTKAVAEAKARAEDEAKAQAQAKEDEEARKKAIENVGMPSATAKTSDGSGKKTHSTTASSAPATSSTPNSASEASTETTTPSEKTQSGNKTGVRGSINGDLTIGYH